jgi:signal recognition particle receptor subunit beta
MWRKKNQQETATMTTTTTTTSTSGTVSDDEDKKNRGTPPVASQQQQQRLLQTTLRESIAPYLPPPVLKAIKEIDPQLEPYVGPEGCITVVGSLLLSYALYQLVRSIFGSSSSSSSSLGDGGKNKAIQEDYRDQDILPVSNEKSRPFDGTIVLCGTSLTGKTSLFYRLIQQEQEQQQKWKTVRSIKSNTGFLEHNRKVLRVLDTPGHWGPEKLIRAVPLQDIDRLLVVVDSTQPVAPAADYLYAILKQQKSKSKNKASVLISCHKSDHPKAKNARRIKLQLRSELIRLSKLDNINDENDNYWEENLNAIPLCSSNVDNFNSVREFCETGAIPSSSTTAKR